ncbi:hypothetical protein [Halalkalibacter akibai]|uniref:DUF3953 domain-containing protein n=1 Tax=Halalkalibacter akibai (strain ATCC 43226 / DSM 21942 / CIP 109018 / JCM 9157 / 1139) TaxID=1236973 RepID=W4R1V2_HALA3|nr:hypothetical protein [Halalkalibacter akibai]GAE37514.1 hypothetical protein JCM9157_4821 [Halalkalibacter akibai JCM 9157]
MLADMKKPKVLLFVIGSAIAYGGLIVSSSVTTVIGFMLILLSLVIMFFHAENKRESVKYSILSVSVVTYVFFFYIY